MHARSPWSFRPAPAAARRLGRALLLALAGALLLPEPGTAQVRYTAVDQEAVYLEVGGNGLLYSFNYDRQLTESVTGRVGVGVYGAVAVPVMLNYLLGEGSSRLELGAGALLLSSPDELEEALDEEEPLDPVMGTLTVGYRYQPPQGGLVFRAGFTPILTLDGAGLPWFGVSLGYAFR